ncbi:unnamed protein product [Alternaria alternata]
MSANMKVLLIGAGGDLGVELLDEFLNSTYELSVMSRKDSSATFPAGAIKSAMKGQDVVISNVGLSGAPHQQIFVDAALATGVKRFFPAEYGTDTRDFKTNEINP